MVVLDSGAVTRLAVDGDARAVAIALLRATGQDRFRVPSMVLVECLTGTGPRDARVNAFVKSCEVLDRVPTQVARRAARLRAKAGRGSAVDALVVALAEPGGLVFTGDLGDLAALAAHAEDVSVEAI